MYIAQYSTENSPCKGTAIDFQKNVHSQYICAIINKNHERGMHMKEQILLLPGANGTEMVRMMARFRKNSLGLRIMNAAELARFALMRSGIIPKESFLPRKLEAAVIDGFVRGIGYFRSAGYADSEKIADALYSLRSLIPENEAAQIHERLPLGEFPDKNESLVAVYDRYLAALQETKNIDTVGLLRKAMAEAAPLTCPVCTLREYPLTPLEEALACRLAPSRTEKSLPQLFGAETGGLRNIDYTVSYGCSNEVEAICEYITANGLSFDECTVAVTEPAIYGQLFYDFFQKQELPVALGCGLPILNSNPARLLKLLYDWQHTGYHGVDALYGLAHSDALDRKKLLAALGLEKERQLEKVIRIAGRLRLSFDREKNEQKLAALPQEDEDARYYPAVAALSGELVLGESRLIEKYTRIREGAAGRVDRSALSVICDTLDAYAQYSGGGAPDLIVPQLLQRAVCSENSREGALFVTGISGAAASMRKHLFVAGLSAAHFPGSPRENYLLLDSDYRLFADEKTAPTSDNLIRRKKQSLEDLLALASALEVQIHLSYSNYDLSEMKEQNPSSVLFELFKRQHGDAADLAQYKAAFRPVGYFGRRGSGTHAVGRAYTREQEITYTETAYAEGPCAYTIDKAFSPSALDVFFSCPKRFFLTRLLGVREAEEDEPFTVIRANEIGDLAHELMEEFAKAPCSRDTFLQRAEAIFDRQMRRQPPLQKEVAAEEKRVFLKMMGNAYDQDPGNQVLASEEEQTFRHSSGVLLKGYPDRVEKTPAGAYIIADYKSGRDIKHKKDDIDTCLQVVIYAYLMEQKKVPITGCEYRYLRPGKTVSCRYDADMKAQLDAKMQEFKEALTTGQFPCATDAEACKYCTLGDICGKAQKEETE